MIQKDLLQTVELAVKSGEANQIFIRWSKENIAGNVLNFNPKIWSSIFAEKCQTKRKNPKNERKINKLASRIPKNKLYLSQWKQ